jgi:hypothetical protein
LGCRCDETPVAKHLAVNRACTGNGHERGDDDGSGRAQVAMGGYLPTS